MNVWTKATLAIWAVIAAAYAWLVAVSFLYCQLASALDQQHRAFPFEYPFMQWLHAAPHWRANWAATASVVGSAALPTILIVLVGVMEWRRRTRAGEPKLYGSQRRADATDMRNVGITSARRRPF